MSNEFLYVFNILYKKVKDNRVDAFFLMLFLDFILK